MKAHVVVSALALVALFAFTAAAADINGKWIAQIPGRDGAMQEQTFTFKVSGEAVTGTISSPRGDQEISEGKLSGDDLTFVVIRKFNEMEMKSVYKGKVAGNEIKFTTERQGGRGRGGPQEFTAKKAQ